MSVTILTTTPAIRETSTESSDMLKRASKMFNAPATSLVKRLSWREKMRYLAKKYPTPESVPNIPQVPGKTELQKYWRTWSKEWRNYYDSTAPRVVPKSTDGKPTFPPPGATDEEWSTWSRAMAAWWSKQELES